MASGRIYGELLQRWSPNFTHLSGTASLTNLSDMTSLADSVRLQNVIQYCTEVSKTGAAGIEAYNSVTV